MRWPNAPRRYLFAPQGGVEGRTPTKRPLQSFRPCRNGFLRNPGNSVVSLATDRRNHKRGHRVGNASVDRANPAINRHRKSGHFVAVIETGEFYCEAAS